MHENTLQFGNLSYVFWWEAEGTSLGSVVIDTGEGVRRLPHARHQAGGTDVRNTSC